MPAFSTSCGRSSRKNTVAVIVADSLAKRGASLGSTRMQKPHRSGKYSSEPRMQNASEAIQIWSGRRRRRRIILPPTQLLLERLGDDVQPAELSR